MWHVISEPCTQSAREYQRLHVGLIRSIGVLAFVVASPTWAQDDCTNAPVGKTLQAAPLPGGLTSWNPAGLGPEWHFVNEAFYAPAISSQPVKSVLQSSHASEGYLYDARSVDTPLASIPRIYADCAPGRMAMWRYRHDASGQIRWFAGKRHAYSVGAYYFDVWSPREGQVVNATRRLYGRDADWWGGVRDFYGKSTFNGEAVQRNTQGMGGTWDQLMPRIGYYDVRLPETLARHIDQAADAGLSYFTFYWYWNKNAESPLLGEGISSFLSAPNRQRLKFNIALFAHPWDSRMHISPADVQVAESIVDLFAKPEYLRLPDGRPVIFIGDSRNIGDGSPAALAEFIAQIKRVSARRAGKVPFVSVNIDVPGAASVSGADGTSCIATGIPEKGPDSYLSMARKTESLYRHALSKGLPFSACVTQMFDERPRQGIMPHSGRYLTGRTDEQFRAALVAARNAADEGRDAASRMITLYAWNEWHEGGTLEPNAATGARDLNIVTDVFRLPRRPSKCLEDNRCGER